MTKSRSNAVAPNAKGTLVVGNGTDASTTLAVASTAGYLLTVDSAEATGLKWAAPSSPSFVGAVAYLNANQSIPNTAETNINWDVEIADTNNFHSNVTNPARFTVPTGYAGKYLFIVSISWANSSTSDRFLTLWKNGTPLGEFSVDGSSVRRTCALSMVFDLAVNDYVYATAYQNSGGALNINGGNTSQTRSQANFIYLGA